jgi:TolA-binding protein
MEKRPSSLDIYYLGRAYYACKEYVNADTNFADFTKMQPKAPDGYLWRAKCQLELDNMKDPKGLASPYYIKFIEVASADVAKNKNNLITAYSYLGFIALHNKDNASAKMNFEKVISIDPENTEAKEQLAKIK